MSHTLLAEVSLEQMSLSDSVRHLPVPGAIDGNGFEKDQTPVLVDPLGEALSSLLSIQASTVSAFDPDAFMLWWMALAGTTSLRRLSRTRHVCICLS